MNHVDGGSFRPKATIYMWQYITGTYIQTQNWVWTSDSSVWKIQERNDLRAYFYCIGYVVLKYLVETYTISVYFNLSAKAIIIRNQTPWYCS
jgi:hypothetical protein